MFASRAGFSALCALTALVLLHTSGAFVIAEETAATVTDLSAVHDAADPLHLDGVEPARSPTGADSGRAAATELGSPRGDEHRLRARDDGGLPTREWFWQCRIGNYSLSRIS